MKTKENGVTLIALVITIILLLILASIGITVGTSTLDSAAFTQFKSELKVMQNKVNELNQSTEKNIGADLSEKQKNILNIEVISNIIYKDVSSEDKEKIQNGFRYCDRKYIQNDFGLDSVKRDYLINVEYRYVIFPDGFEYEGTTYYMIDQIEEEIYNVRYNNKNEKSGSFDVNTTKEDNKWKIEISNIQYNGYVDKWQVKYKLDGTSYWETSNDLTFYLRDEGTYTIKVIHGDEIDLGTQTVKVLFDGLISDKVKNEIVKIGDYVQYTPDIVSTTDEAYTNLISELGTYSGSTENTTSTLTQESLNWRVLDITKDDDGKSTVRLISELPTTSTVVLEGYNGYNNAVYLLDKTCITLYNKTGYTEKVQNLKIEDIQIYMKVTDYSTIDSEYGNMFTPENKYYPSIFAEEKDQTIITSSGITQPEIRLDFSEQATPINQIALNMATSWTVKYTYWGKTMNESDFKDLKYYELFLNNGNNKKSYWISSRCISAGSNYIYFRVGFASTNGGIGGYTLYGSHDYTRTIDYAIRPVITLKSNVKIDTTDVTRDGSTAENSWILKSE